MIKKFVVTPASRWQVEMINYLRKKKFYVMSLDDDSHAIGHKFSNKRLFIKTKNKKELFKFSNKIKIFFLSVCSDFGEKICNNLNKKNNILFNKFHQREIQKKIDLPIPFYRKNFLYKEDVKKYKKIICKPLNGSGSNNISLIKSLSKNIIKKGYLFEEFIEGKEYNIDGFYFEKKFYLYGIFEKKKIYKSYSVSYLMKSCSLSKKKIDKIIDNLNSFFKAIKYPNGPIHAEIIINKKNKQPLIVESHPREVGFDLYYNCLQKVTGLNLLKNKLNIIIKKKIRPNELESKNKFKFYCIRMIPIKKKGRIKKIGFSKIKKNKHVRIYTDLFVKQGDEVSYKKNDASRLGSITCLSNSVSNLEKFSRSIFNKNFKLKYY